MTLRKYCTRRARENNIDCVSWKLRGAKKDNFHKGTKTRVVRTKALKKRRFSPLGHIWRWSFLSCCAAKLGDKLVIFGARASHFHFFRVVAVDRIRDNGGMELLAHGTDHDIVLL